MATQPCFLFQLHPNLWQKSLDGKNLTEPSKEKLRKDLESELRLDSGDIRSYAWYHGKLPRDIAEHLVQQDGDFLIRESITSSGENVLTMRYDEHDFIDKINLRQIWVY